MSSPLTLLIGYYHGLLLRDIDVNLLINNMCSKGLLSPDDQSLISTGHSAYQRKWFVLEHVKHMDTKVFLEFCELVQNFWPEVGSQLITGIYIHAAILILYMHNIHMCTYMLLS